MQKSKALEVMMGKQKGTKSQRRSGFVPDSPGKGTSTKREGVKSTKGGTSSKKK